MDQWKLAEAFDYQGRMVRFGRTGEGPPLVLVHGTPWSSFNFRHLIRRLSSCYAVHYFDLLGYGQSSKDEGDVSLGIQNRVLDRLLDHWGLDEPFVIGHDFGATTALRTCLLDGRRFRKIVLVDAVALSPWGTDFFRHVNTHETAFAGLPDYLHEALVRAYVQTAAFGPLDETTLQGIVSAWTGEQGKSALYRQMAQADSRYTDEIEPLYGTITTPVLIVWGREDRWIPLDQADRLHGLIPGSALRVIDDAGHLVIEEKPDELLAEILPFLRN